MLPVGPEVTETPGGIAETPGAFVYAPALAEAELRPDHPLKLWRARDCFHLLEESGFLGPGRGRVVAPHPASDEDIRRVHSTQYVEVVRCLSLPGWGGLAGDAGSRFGLIAGGENPLFEGM